MHFFQDETGTFYPVSSVKSYTLKYADGGRTEVKAIVGQYDDRVNVPANFASNILNAGSTVVAAQPGFYYVGLVRDEGSKSVWVRPIVAWLVPVDGDPVPITLNGPRDGVGNDYAIGQPDGALVEQSIQDYPDVRAYVLDKGFSDDEVVDAVNEWRRGTKHASRSL